MTALKERGFAKNGRAIAASGRGTSEQNHRTLTGTLEVHVYGAQGFDSPFPALVQQAGATIDAIANAIHSDRSSNDSAQSLTRVRKSSRRTCSALGGRSGT